MSGDDTSERDAAAIRLALALKRLRARLRKETGANVAGLSVSQLSVLQRLRLDGAATAASLAAAEHVSQQAIAQCVAPLRSAGLVRATPDPGDGRKSLISITDAGLGLRESIAASRHSWLARAIDSTVDARERAALTKAIELLERLADADTR
jgi:DNA-binding MarR family transcriptional regulator